MRLATGREEAYIESCVYGSTATCSRSSRLWSSREGQRSCSLLQFSDASFVLSPLAAKNSCTVPSWQQVLPSKRILAPLQGHFPISRSFSNYFTLIPGHTSNFAAFQNTPARMEYFFFLYFFPQRMKHNMRKRLKGPSFFPSPFWITLEHPQRSYQELGWAEKAKALAVMALHLTVPGTDLLHFENASCLSC